MPNPDRHQNPGILGLVICVAVAFICNSTLAGPPYLTGTIADGDSQQVILPRLPGAWMRTIAWMAPEGEFVQEGDLVVRLDPGNLISTEESAEIALEERRLRANLTEARQELAILDAKTSLVNAETSVRIAEIDAEIPEDVQTSLMYEQSQLALLNAQNALRRAQNSLNIAIKKRDQQRPVTQRSIAQAELEWQRAKNALDSTEIRAEHSGIMIYGENESTGTKIFPGETCAAGTLLATIARRESLHFRIWVHEADIRKVQKGTLLRVTPDALLNKSVGARVDWVSSQATSRTNWGSAGHFAVTASPTEKLAKDFLPGMSIMAEVVDP